MLSSVISRYSTFLPSSLLLAQFENFLFHHGYYSTPSKPQNLTSFPNYDDPNSSPPLNLPASSTSASFESLNPTIVQETLSCYNNDWRRALEFFNWTETQCGFQHTIQTCNQLIDILGKFFEFDAAWNMIEKMSSVPSMPDHTTFRVLFKRYVSAHMVKEAIDMFDKAEEFNLRDHISFSNLIDALCEYKHVIEAEELCFPKNKNDVKYSCFKVDTKICNMLLRGWFKMSWWGKCRQFWEEMDTRGVQKDLYSYSIYMDVQCKSGKPWKTVKLYKEMKKKGIDLDVIAYNTVIRAIGISDGVDVAAKLCQEMIELGCKPNVSTYNTLIKLMCENGRYKDAYRLLNQMPSKGCEPNVITYNCFFGCLGKPREILKLFDRMIESGVRPRMDTYVMLMRKFGRWGFLRPVFILWEKMEKQGLSPDVSAYNALIDTLVQKGMVDMARKYDEEMLARGLSAKPRVELGTKLTSADCGSS
uniref:Pentatricopeptide repeat-containing protein At1g80550, mitochondrial isoform X1 n=1 Tax=Nicotiana tabacum TaxID=4097 RepID=A0A1S4BSV1_TOBAC|nr:PREDICTED: pentatricopeptide repeat-containing protein At1g80550, mitochondrial-like isoform X1 [Nicotiana tabacum]XP_016491966.1 PREDICTED: pentatricopeptide repeat-containing protein At1g80550, mitochondrial-like isoform X1 [Nicotiana tabacum]